MDFNRFKTEVEHLLSINYLQGQYIDHDKEFDTSSNSWVKNEGWRKKQDTTPALEISWETGGVSGGGCWESSNPLEYTTKNTRKELSSLDMVLREMCPGLSYIDFMEIKSLVNQGERIVEEYYGNRIDYCTLRIELEPLHDFLKNRNLLLETRVPGP